MGAQTSLKDLKVMKLRRLITHCRWIWSECVIFKSIALVDQPKQQTT